MSDMPTSVASPLDRLRERVGIALAGFAAWADSRWFFPAVLAATVVGLFFDAVGPDCVFAYRDSLHFYPPLYRLVREEWLAGRVPLWNPLLNCGQPLAAMGTAGAFYIPQLLLTTVLPDGVSLNVFCIAHLALAATGAYSLARDQGCSRPAATVAGVAYGFCGSVFFQIYNPIYAAGAAWLVWAVRAGLRLLQGGGLRDGLYQAMSILLPGYGGFRYPAKWMTVFALALSQLVGGGLTLLAEPGVRAGWGRAIAAIRNWALGGLLVGLAAAAIVGVENVLPGAEGDARRGLAWWAVMRGGALAATAAAAAGVVLSAVSRGEGKPGMLQGASVAIALVAAIDLVVACRGEIVVEPFSELVASSGYLKTLPTAQPLVDTAQRQSTMVKPRLYVIGANPKFADTRNPRRFVRYAGLMGRSHVPWLHGAGLVGEVSTAMPADLERLFEPRRIDGLAVPPRRVADLSGVEYFVVSLEGLDKATGKAVLGGWSPGQQQGAFEGPLPGGDRLPMQPLWLPGEEDDAPAALLVKNTAFLPRARIVREVEVRPLGSPTADEIACLSTGVAAVTFTAHAHLAERHPPLWGRRHPRRTEISSPFAEKAGTSFSHKSHSRLIASS